MTPAIKTPWLTAVVFAFSGALTGAAAAAALSIVLIAGTAGRASAQSPATQPAAQAGQTAARPEKKPKDTGEYDIINEAIRDLSGTNPQKTLADLNTWTQKYPESDYKDDRLFYLMQAYSVAQPAQPDKVLEYGAQLMAKDLKTALKEPARLAGALFGDGQRAGNQDPTPAQLVTGQKAAKDLQASVPTYFTPVIQAGAGYRRAVGAGPAQVEQDGRVHPGLHSAVSREAVAMAKRTTPRRDRPSGRR